MLLTRRARPLLFVALLPAAVPDARVAAQSAPPRKWEIEVHAGGLASTRPTGGIVHLPGPGEALSTAGIYGPPAPPVLVVATTRRQSSWYFGDGPVLFNQAATALAANPVAMTAPFPGRLVTLDPVLMRSLDQGWRGGSVGARLTRALTPRFSVEFGVDYSIDRLEITRQNQEAIEATRASFIPAFTGLITSNASRALASITSTASLDAGRAHSLLTSGVLNVNVMTKGGVMPYLTAGAGMLAVIGRLPAVAMNGNYQFSNTTTGARFDETDSVTVADSRDVRSAFAIFGGGAKFNVAARWGVRVDAQMAVGANTSRTILTAAPNVVLGQLPAGRVTLHSDPTIQFGNSSGPITGLGVTAPAPSTLTGPPITGPSTFSGTGFAGHLHLTAGIFWRF